MNIQLDLNHEQAKELLADLEKAEAIIEKDLERVRFNIKSVKNFLSPVRLIGTVASSRYPYTKRYSVTEQAGDYFCTCPSFEFKRGLDLNGRCKHIRSLIV